MKTLLLLLLLTSLLANAQVKYAVIAVQDQQGNVDTTLFGFDPRATLGVDNQLGELEMSNSPWQRTEIRSVNSSQMCYAYRMYPTSNPLYELKYDLRDSVYGLDPSIALDTNRPFDGQNARDVAHNSFNFKVSCGAPPCSLYLKQNWPFIQGRWSDGMTAFVYKLDAAGQMGCSYTNVLNVSGLNPNSAEILGPGWLDTVMYVNIMYWSGSAIRLPKSLKDLGLHVKNHELVLVSGTAPQEVQVVDALGRSNGVYQWPEGQDRLVLPPFSPKLYVYRIRYADRMVGIRQLEY